MVVGCISCNAALRNFDMISDANGTAIFGIFMRVLSLVMEVPCISAVSSVIILQAQFLTNSRCIL